MLTNVLICEKVHLMEGTVTTAELARRLGTSPSTISRWVEQGKLTPVAKLPGVRGAFLFADRQESPDAKTEGSES